MRKIIPNSLFPLSLAALFLTLAGCVSSPGNCPSAQADCSGQCLSTATDPDHCGSCTTVCTAEQVCSQGTCATSCGSGLFSCSRSCVDTATDATNCGVCGMRCTAGATCQVGRCVGMVAECKDRLTLQASGAYDKNLQTVHISGRLTRNGAVLPNGTYRGSLVFIDKRGGVRSLPSFSSSGEATYSGELFVGAYDVSYQPSPYCRTGDSLPCQQVLLQTDVQIAAAGALDFDVKTIQVAGKFTKNGATVPDDTTDRGTVVFALANGSARSMPPLGLTGDATYSGELIAGVYDISYQPNAYCKTGGALPCQQTLLRSKVQLSANGALDFDVKTIQVTGRLTKNGATVPDDTTDRGSLAFVLASGGTRYMPALGLTGDATYKGDLFAGTYDITYQPNSYCKNLGALPCQSASLRTHTALLASGALDFDIKTVQVTGKLSKNGATVPDDTTDRGSLMFSLLTGGARYMPALGLTGEAIYKGELVAGTYDITYQPNTYCKTGGVLPCQAVVLGTKTALLASGALDFNAKTILVSGKLTKNGTAVPDDTTDRGSLSFSLDTGGTRYMPALGLSGAATYQGELFAGTYDIRYQPNTYCKTGGALPCQQTILRTATPLMAAGALDFDLKTVTVSGMVSKNGAAVPTDVTDRGSLVFSLAGGGSRAMPAFGLSGPATYQGEIFAGSYDVNYQPNAYCKTGGALPCQGLLAVGCPPVPKP